MNGSTVQKTPLLMSLKRSVFPCSLVWWFSTLRFSGCSSSPWQHLLHSQYTSCLFFLHFPRQSNVKVPPFDLSSTPAHRIYHYTHRLNNPTYNSCTIHAVSPADPSIVWYGWKRCCKYIYVFFAPESLLPLPTSSILRGCSTLYVEYYTKSPASISPRSMVASLLPVRTEEYGQGGSMRMEKKNVLMGSLGWKSTAVTVPLWPGSCEGHA